VTPGNPGNSKGLSRQCMLYGIEGAFILFFISGRMYYNCLK